MVLRACGGRRTPHPGARGQFAPRRAARGASGPPRRSRLSRGPGLRAHPFSRRPAYDQSCKGIRPLLAGTWRTWCELRGRRHASTPASLPTPASPPVSRRDGLMRALACPVLWGGPRPLPEELSATRRDGLALELALLGTRGGPHRTTHHLPPSCRRTWLGSTPKGSPLDQPSSSSCWTTFLPATSGTPWKAQVRLAAAAGLPGAVALELAAGKQWAGPGLGDRQSPTAAWYGAKVAALQLEALHVWFSARKADSDIVKGMT